MNIVLHYSNNPPFTSESHKVTGIGGTENFACNVAATLVQLGHQVSFYNMLEGSQVTSDGVKWYNAHLYDPKQPSDVLISFRMREVFQQENNAKVKVLILADTESVGLGEDIRAGRIDKVIAVSRWQMDKIAKEEGLEDHPCWLLGSNGINPIEFGNWNPLNRKTGMCIHLSTPERGLSQLLKVWPYVEDSYIIKAREITPELHLFSSFRGWGTSETDNEAMCKDLYQEIDNLKAKGLHIINHKHANVFKIREFQSQADLFVYPTNFKETYCMSLQESMYAGAIPVVSNIGAMPERVNRNFGYVVGEPEEDSFDESYIRQFASKIVEAITDSNFKTLMRRKAHEAAALHSYNIIIPNWLEVIQSKL